MLLRQRADFVSRLAGVEQPPASDVAAENEIFQHGQCRNQHEVLMHHANAGCNRILRRVQRERAVAQFEPAAIGQLKPVKHFHEGRFAGAVLAQHGVNFAGPQVERNLGVRHDGAIGLCDPDRAEKWGFRHPQGPSTPGPSTPFYWREPEFKLISYWSSS
jgi:hypothetical protein